MTQGTFFVIPTFVFFFFVLSLFFWVSAHLERQIIQSSSSSTREWTKIVIARIGKRPVEAAA